MVVAGRTNSGDASLLEDIARAFNVNPQDLA